MSSQPINRRQFLAASAFTAGLSVQHSRAAAAATCAAGSLSAIEHVVIMMQENRSFDHYFGAYRGVRGFDDPAGVFAQPGYPPGRHPDGKLLPFHLDSVHMNGECPADTNHDWGPQHRCWANGRMDGWVTTHLDVDGAAGTNTMGYFTRADLAFYYALADAFTICDNYFCSALSATDPNRLHAMSGTIDPDGRAGGPIAGSAGTPTSPPALSWTTMPEQLEARGISWKVYAATESTYQDGDNTLLFFKQYHRNPTLFRKALLPTFPAEFAADVAASSLPQVSWVIAPTAQLEHPPGPSVLGELAVHQLLEILLRNRPLWSKTVAFVTWDENGGLFDHVPPPTPPPGTKGERITTATLPPEAMGIREPIGLGFRVPTFVLSPFARGGYVNSDVFDHTSTLRFLETRFGAEVPNLSAWRREAVGDLTSTLDLSAPDPSVPALPNPADDLGRVARECGNAAAGGTVYPVPANRRPRQEHGAAKRRPCAVPGRRPAAARTKSSLPATGTGFGPTLLGAVGAIAAAGYLRRRATQEQP